MKQWYLDFNYNKKGRGVLRLHNDSIIPFDIEARTGSINTDGKLVNPITPGDWTGRAVPVETTEPGMIWEGWDVGWKWRLWTPEGVWSRYLIHPDGDGKGKGNSGNGTLGCIGTQGQAEELRERLDWIMPKQEIVPVYINQPIP